MRRLLTMLVILLIVLVAGMSALVLLVNPNDFRAYMVKQVEKKSGYHLQLEGDLRWHVWPQTQHYRWAHGANRTWRTRTGGQC